MLPVTVVFETTFSSLGFFGAMVSFRRGICFVFQFSFSSLSVFVSALWY